MYKQIAFLLAVSVFASCKLNAQTKADSIREYNELKFYADRLYDTRQCYCPSKEEMQKQKAESPYKWVIKDGQPIIVDSRDTLQRPAKKDSLNLKVTGKVMP